MKDKDLKNMINEMIHESPEFSTLIKSLVESEKERGDGMLFSPEFREFMSQFPKDMDIRDFINNPEHLKKLCEYGGK